jgi:predicted nucleic acid-binding Zn ribbon protein
MQQLRNLIDGVIHTLQSPQLQKRTELVKNWPNIAGPKISPHTRPTLKDNGELCVWVDQSSLAFELNQKYSASLLKRVQAVLGEEAVKTIRFRVGQLR